MFLNISRWLATTEKPPKKVVLENVPGLMQRNKFGVAPIDFIMYGKVKGPSGVVEYGLSYLQRYHVVPPTIISSRNLGLPMVRKRVFIVLGRTDVMTKDEVLVLSTVLHALSSHVPHKLLAIDACMMDDRTGGTQ